MIDRAGCGGARTSLVDGRRLSLSTLASVGPAHSRGPARRQVSTGARWLISASFRASQARNAARAAPAARDVAGTPLLNICFN